MVTPWGIWCVAGCIDLVEAGQASVGELSIKQMTGKGLPSGKGVLDVLLAKHELAAALTQKASEIGLTSKTIEACTRWGKSHVNYRSDMGFRPGSTDTHWIAALPAHDQKFLQLFQEAVFTPTHDMAMKQQKISGGPIHEMLTRDPFKSPLETIADEQAKLTQGKPQPATKEKDGTLNLDDLTSNASPMYLGKAWPRSLAPLPMHTPRMGLGPRTQCCTPMAASHRPNPLTATVYTQVSPLSLFLEGMLPTLPCPDHP